jgi:hypothetical protein
MGVRQAEQHDLHRPEELDGHGGRAEDGNVQGRCSRRDWSKSFYQILTNQPGKEAWPIVGATFVLLHAKQDKPEQGAETLKFFSWAFKNGEKAADSLDYVRCRRRSKRKSASSGRPRSRTQRASRSPPSKQQSGSLPGRAGRAVRAVRPGVTAPGDPQQAPNV